MGGISRQLRECNHWKKQLYHKLVLENLFIKELYKRTTQSVIEVEQVGNF